MDAPDATDTWLSLPYEHAHSLPPGVDELRTPDALVERFLREHTEPGDRVLDPFAGFGTTLAVAERLDREPFGIEYEPERVAYVRERLGGNADDERIEASADERPGTGVDDRVRRGSVLELEADWFPTCDYCFTSPPFTAEWMDSDPFQNYEGSSSYEGYLDDVERAFERVDRVLAPGARVVVDASNMKLEDEVTTLAWDLAERVRTVFAFEGEVVVTWTGEGDPDRPGTFGYGYDHSYCLVFSNDGE